METKTTLKGFLLFVCLISISFLNASDLKEVTPVSNNVLLLVFDDGHIDYAGVDAVTGDYEGMFGDDHNVYWSFLDIVAAQNTSSYSVTIGSNTVTPTNVYLKGKGRDYNDTQGGDGEPDEIMKYHVYLELPQNLTSGQLVTVNTGSLAENMSEYSFTFNEEEVRSESIHVNQIGFTPSQKKYFYLSQWMGDGNPLDLSAFSTASWSIYDLDSKSVVKSYTGIPLQKPKEEYDNRQKGGTDPLYINFTLADIYSGDFSDFNTPGRYKIVVNGLGCSFPFEIGEDVYREPFYTTMRGMYFQRGGITKLVEEFDNTMYPRAHHSDMLEFYYDGSQKVYGHGDISGFSYTNKINEEVYGWYYDAGDWDYYDRHWSCPATMLLLYNLKPGNFADGDISNKFKYKDTDFDWINEGNNGIPDLLDEARWMIEFGKRFKDALVAEGYGTGGVPGYVGEEAGYGSMPSSGEERQMRVCAEMPASTSKYAGCAALYAYSLEYLNSQGGSIPQSEIDMWYNEAVAAYNWSEARYSMSSGTELEGHMFAAACLYLYTGDAQYQDNFEYLFMNNPSQGNGMWMGLGMHALAPAVYATLCAGKPNLNTTFYTNEVVDLMTRKADACDGADFGFRLGGIEANQWINLTLLSVPKTFYQTIAYELTGTPSYLESVQNTTSYFFGANPENLSKLTGIGDFPETDAFHIDSWYYFDYNDKVYENPILPGYSVYGLKGNFDVSGNGNEARCMQTFIPTIPFTGNDPQYQPWPMGEGRSFSRWSITGSEFTVDQSNIWTVFAAGYLCGSNSSGFTPNKAPTVVLNLEENQDLYLNDGILTVTTSNDVEYVEYYYDWHYLGKSLDAASNFQFNWDASQNGFTVGETIEITAVAYDDQGLISNYNDEADKMVTFSSQPCTGSPSVTIDNCPGGNLLLDQNYQLETTITDPCGIVGNQIIWTSSDAGIATVDINGNVTGVSAGTATITGQIMNNPATATCNITVENSPCDIAPTITLDKSTDHMVVDQLKCMNASMSDPCEKLPNPGITWASSDTNIVKVDMFGCYTAKAKGSATITAELADGTSSTCSITVLGIGDGTKTITIEPVADTYVDDAGTSNYGDDNNIFVRGGKNGLMKFDLSGVDGVITSARLQMKLKLYNTGATNEFVSTTDDWTEMGVTADNGPARGDVFYTYAVPADQTDYEIGVLAETENALDKTLSFYLLGSGAWIRYDSKENGNASDNPKLVISYYEIADVPVSGVTLDKAAMTLETGQTGTLTETIEPSNATNKSVSWSSGNESVATVTNGVVTAISAGTATITVTTTDGGFTAQCAVTVQDPPTYTLSTNATNGSISINPQKAEYNAGETVELTANPNSGYLFSDWSGDITSTSNPVTITMDGDKSVTANFTAITYTLSLTSLNGNISVSPDKTSYNAGETIELTAIPNAGYQFDNWSVDASGTVNPVTLTMDANKSVTANFSLITYSLSINATNGTVAASPDKTLYTENESVALVATPNTGYDFVNWTGDLTSSSPNETIIMDNDKVVTANFAIKTYTLTYAAGANGSITGNTSQTVNHGTNGSQVEAIPNSGYTFINWSDGSTQNPRTDLNVTGNINVSATFDQNVITYSLSYTAGSNGTITGVSSQTIIENNDGSEVTAVPNTGYHFVDWSDGITQNPRQDLNVTSDISVSANFAINNYTLSYGAGANGSVQGATSQSVDHGADGSEVTALAATGYHFVDWSDGSTQNPRTDLAVTSDITVTANFAINNYTIRYIAGSNGSLSGSSIQSVDHGGNGNAITAIPNIGYEFTGWSDGQTNATRTEMNVTSDITVTANFATIVNYTLTINTNNGSVTANPQKTKYDENESVTLTATPDTGYEFTGWSGDATGTNPTTTITMDGDKTITATFTALSTYTLSITAENGSVALNPDKTSYYQDEVVSLTAVPDAGYAFENWTGDLSGTTETIAITMNSDKNVTATFSSTTTYTLNISSPMNGTIIASPNKTVYELGEQVTLSAIPDNDYQFESWIGDASGSDSILTITMDDDKTIGAMFSFISTSIDQASAINILVYPNPATQVINMANMKKGDQVHFINMLGNIILSKEIDSTSPSIELDQLDKGIYILTVERDGVIISLNRLVKQ